MAGELRIGTIKSIMTKRPTVMGLFDLGAALPDAPAGPASEAPALQVTVEEDE
jgi:hypothetical protein